MDPETLKEAYRVLSPNGILVIVGIIEITGSSLPDRFARWLYTVTGQSGSTPLGWDQVLIDHGFQPRLEEINLDRSIVTRIVAMRT
jgi:hypothetical protein